MKKVLIISYYWPPCGGAGVQRWAKFSKYLPQFGWEPIVYTPENPEMPVIDHSLEKDVVNVKILKQPIWEPYSLYKKFIGQDKSSKIQTGFLSEKKKPALTEKISVWLRGNLFIPDARKFWIKPSVRFLTKYLIENPVDAIVSTGPPHSMHLIALGIKKKLNLPWIADFRDPWTNIDFYNKLMLSGYTDNLHKKLERNVIQSADKLVTVSYNWAEDFRNLGATEVEVITNGYDEDDFNFNVLNLHKKFTLSHIGSLNKDRNPLELWKAIKELTDEVSEFKEDLHINFVGKTDYTVFEALAVLELMGKTEKIEYMPHSEIVKFSSSSQILLLLLNNTPNVLGVIPGKIFEYLATNRPILCIGPGNGDSAQIIKETSAGRVVDFLEKDKMKAIIKHYYELFKVNKLQLFPTNIEKYSRKNLTKDMVEHLNAVSGK